MRWQILIGIAAAGFGLGGRAAAQAPSGALEISGSSTMGDWKCREPRIQVAQGSPAGAAERPPAAGSSPPGVMLTFRVQDIDCGDALMNDHLRQALKADSHPTISLALPSSQVQRAARAAPASIPLDGSLTIAGRTEPVRTEVTITPAPGHALQVRGEQSLRMSDFGVKPPRLLLGALKVRDLVRVAFDFVLRAPTAALLGRRAVR